MNGAEDQDHGPAYLEGPAYATPCAACQIAEMERTWLHMLAFLMCAWLVIGGTLAGITLAATGSVWALTWLAPCALLIVAALIQRGRVTKATERAVDDHVQRF